MLLLTCPNCGIAADETELSYGHQAHLTRHGAGSNDDDFEDYMFMRKNPRGVHFERWRHVYGCGKWFHAARNTVTNQVYGTYSAQVFEPPKDLITKIKQQHPDWEGFTK